MQYRYITDLKTNQNSTEQILRIADDGVLSVVPNDPANKDWVVYQVWLALGNTPYVAD